MGGAWCAPKASATIDVGHKKKVDLGVLRGAECHGRDLQSPFSTVDGARSKFNGNPVTLGFGDHFHWTQHHRFRGGRSTRLDLSYSNRVRNHTSPLATIFVYGKHFY